MREAALRSPVAAGYDDRVAPVAESRPRTRVLLGASTMAAATLAIIAFVVSFLLPLDFDYWWHLADGRFMLARHALPAADPYSFTAAGQPLVVHEWLAELPMYLLHQAFGSRGPLALFALCVAALVVLTFGTLRRVGVSRGLAFGLSCLTLAAIWSFTGARPQVAGFALTAAVIWLLERWIARRDRSIWALPVLIWLWGNLHGSYAIGLALPAAVLAGELLASCLQWKSGMRLETRDRLRLAAAIAVSLTVLVLNPNGLSLLMYPLSKLNDPLAKQAIDEWMATDISNPIFWPFALLAGGYLALVFVRRPRLPASDLLLAAALIAAALSTRKYVPFAAIALTVLVGRVLALPNHGDVHAPAPLARLATWRGHRNRPPASPNLLTQTVNLVALLALTGVAVLVVRLWDPMALTRTQIPVAAVDALGAKGLAGPLFNDYNWGGYLIWRLGPQTRVFIDGRGDDLYTRPGVLRGYLDVIQLKSKTEAILDQYNIQTVLIQKDTPLTRYLLATGTWRSSYDDGRVVKLERRQ